MLVVGVFLKRVAACFAAGCLLFFLSLVLFGCGKEENITSSVNFLLTDSPIDDQRVKGVNIVISDIAWKRGGKWISLVYLEQPINVDLLSLSEGKTFLLLTQFVEPDTYSALRLTLQIAKRDASLMINPLSTIEFVNDSTCYLYWFDDQPTEVVVEADMHVPGRQHSQFVIDFDLRKSIRLTSKGEYILEPVLRLVNANGVSFIKAVIFNAPEGGRVLVYAYKMGVFSDSETVSLDETVAFKNSVTSARLDGAGGLLIPFLEPGEYELIFVEYSEAGEAMEVLKREPNIEVTVGKEVPATLKIDLG